MKRGMLVENLLFLGDILKTTSDTAIAYVIIFQGQATLIGLGAEFLLPVSLGVTPGQKCKELLYRETPEVLSFHFEISGDLEGEFPIWLM